jgi:hypothetical protein
MEGDPVMTELMGIMRKLAEPVVAPVAVAGGPRAGGTTSEQMTPVLDAIHARDWERLFLHGTCLVAAYGGQHVLACSRLAEALGADDTLKPLAMTAAVFLPNPDKPSLGLRMSEWDLVNLATARLKRSRES